MRERDWFIYIEILMKRSNCPFGCTKYDIRELNSFHSSYSSSRSVLSKFYNFFLCSQFCFICEYFVSGKGFGNWEL